MSKETKKSITPQDISLVKEEINNKFLKGETINLTFIKGKNSRTVTCQICGVYPTLFRVKTQFENLSVNYVDLLTGCVILN